MIKVKLGRAVGRTCSMERKNHICTQHFDWETRKEETY